MFAGVFFVVAVSNCTTDWDCLQKTGIQEFMPQEIASVHQHHKPQKEKKRVPNLRVNTELEKDGNGTH